MNNMIKETDKNNVIGTSFYNDTINASVNELIGILHIEPFKNFDNKTKFQWCLEYYSETLNKRFYFTIYDYKEDWDSYVEFDDISDDLYATKINWHKINWHIGGKCVDDTSLAKIALTNELKEFRNID